MLHKFFYGTNNMMIWKLLCQNKREYLNAKASLLFCRSLCFAGFRPGSKYWLGRNQTNSKFVDPDPRTKSLRIRIHNTGLSGAEAGVLPSAVLSPSTLQASLPAPQGTKSLHLSKFFLVLRITSSFLLIILFIQLVLRCRTVAFIWRN